MHFSGALELHDGIGRADSVGKFSSIVSYFAPIPHPQPNQPERQQAAQLGAALGGGHRRRGERIGAADGTGIEHHDPWVQDRADERDLGTGHPAPGRKG